MKTDKEKKEEPGRCEICGCEIHKTETICGECACEDDCDPWA